MATPIGTNAINSISRRYIYPTIFDQFYKSNVIFYRMVAQNKKMLQGGLQIEIPLGYTGMAAGGFYSGFDLLDVSPSDTVKNAAFDWKQAYSPVSIDSLSLIRADSPEAVVNFLSFYFENAMIDLADKLGASLFYNTVSGGVLADPKQLDSICSAVDGSAFTTYGGLTRTGANAFWASNVDTSTTALTAALMQSSFGTATIGGRHPTIGVTTQNQYNKIWALFQGSQAFPVQPGGHDEQLAQAGFTNILFNGVPIVVDSHVPTTNAAGSGTGNLFFWLNEDYIRLFVNPRADFTMKEFREPVNQDAMTSLILWAGNLVFMNTALHYKFTNLT